MTTKIYQDFLDFHEANPEIYKKFAELCFFLYTQIGIRKTGVALVWERMRWDFVLETRSTDGFKLNNNHKAYYARLFMNSHPMFRGFFNIRVTAGERLSREFENAYTV